MILMLVVIHRDDFVVAMIMTVIRLVELICAFGIGTLVVVRDILCLWKKLWLILGWRSGWVIIGRWAP